MEKVDANEQALAAETKTKNCSPLLAKRTFVLDDFKFKYSNEHPLCGVAIFLGAFGKDDLDLWYSEYCFPEEFSQNFLICSLIIGMFQIG